MSLPSRVAHAVAPLAIVLSMAVGGCTRSSTASPYFGNATPPDGQHLRYISGAEPETLDPQLTTGQPEARIILALFDGLVEFDPRTAQPIPGLASRWDVNEDNTVFTFHLREGLQWSDGTPLTADEVAWSIRRGLTPALAARAAYLAYDIVHAQDFNEGRVFLQDPSTGAYLMQPDAADAVADGPDAIAQRLSLPSDAAARTTALATLGLSRAQHWRAVPVTAADVGIETPDARTVRFRLRAPTPYFPGLVGHQFFRPAPRRVIERYGDAWLQPGRAVTSGAFVLSAWRPYDAVVVTRNPRYWDAATVRLDTITFFAVEDQTTMMNLYKAGDVDATFNHTVPASWISHVRQFRDYQDAPEAAMEYLAFNTKRAPTDDVRVRRALNLAVDKDALARRRRVAKASTTMVPDGIFPGYAVPAGARFNPEAARRLLADAGYRDANGAFSPAAFPAADVELTYNTTESNKATAEFVQAQWKANLGITVALRNMEFKTFLQTRAALDYKGLARAGWVGDFMDPFTFLSLFALDGGDNGTGWTSSAFTDLLARANRDPNPERRNALLADAERLMLDAQPVLPLYASGTNWVKKPYVSGMYANPVTLHPWKFVWIEHDPAKWDTVTH